MPKQVILIAAVTVDGFIARHSLEVTSWSKDLHVFKEQTMGYPVIMGYNTNQTLSNHLEGRETIIVRRGENPKDILNSIKQERCFVIGGGKTNQLFASFLTHLCITPHPYIFGNGVPLFDDLKLKEIKLKFKSVVEIDKECGIFQYQYKVLRF